MEKILIKLLIIPTIGGLIMTIYSISINDFSSIMGSIALTVFGGVLYTTGIIMEEN